MCIRDRYGTSFFYPVSAVGSHVSAVPNHQTGRSTSIETRGTVAMAGSFGYELDLNTLSEEEKREVAKQIRTYKEYQPLIHLSLIHIYTHLQHQELLKDMKFPVLLMKNIQYFSILLWNI